jgi:SAM-dependent methyltransferase
MTSAKKADMTTVTRTEKFSLLPHCWICGGHKFDRVHEAIFDFALYREQDAGLADYTGERIWLNRCKACGFGQPELMPTLPNYFDRMYEQRWSDDWIASEFESQYKNYIFHGILDRLSRLTAELSSRRLLDVGAHVGQFVHLAQQSGWGAEGVELNPRTSAFAARKTGAPIHRVHVQELGRSGRHYDVITLTDVLEHIPDPLSVLAALQDLLVPGGWVAVKVPHGGNQRLKERWRARLFQGYRPQVADNLVHVNHFTPLSLSHGLRKTGFASICIEPGAPELVPRSECHGIAQRLSRGSRIVFYHVASVLPKGANSPFSMNLQAYAQKPL